MLELLDDSLHDCSNVVIKVPLGKYQKNWLTTNLMKLMHLRLTKGLDLVSILVYIVLLAYPFDHNDAKIGQLWFGRRYFI